MSQTIEEKLKSAVDSVGSALRDGAKDACAATLYKLAKEQYASIGVDTDAALAKLAEIEISLHCWQGDDVGGFESSDAELSGGIMTTGNYPGKATNSEQLFADLGKAMSLLPGRQKANIHASYLTSAEKPDRDLIGPANYQGWVDWAKGLGIGLDFNSTYFSHPKFTEYSLCSADKGIRDFWIEHGKRSREVGEYLGRSTGKVCVINHWIPDGSKDNPIDKYGPRQRLVDSCDTIFARPMNPAYAKDSLESKLFGIGAEAYTPGSNEFYLAYAASRKNILVTLDSGHFHPTESVAQKISAMLCFLPELLLHVSRPIRWDSDHVVIMDDELSAMMNEVVRCDAIDRTYLSLDYFDASINRVAAWVIGTRNTQKALLAALLQPTEMLKKLELEGDYTSRLALTEEYKSYPLGAVWDYFCHQFDVPVREKWLEEVKTYEKEVQFKR